MVRSRYTTDFPTLWNSFFEDGFRNYNSSDRSVATLPKVNIVESEDSFLIEVAAPGMKKEDFKIDYNNGHLTIASEKKDDEKDGEGYTRREFSYQSFKRGFEVSPKVVDGDKINAKYVDGILSIALPKREEVKPKPAKEISIA